LRGPAPTLQETPSGARERIGYFDVLRAAALLRVITYHTVGWPWLHVLIPAIGVMFGLGGSLMASSLSRRSAASVVATRVRRLLPPVWAFGIVALAAGWITLGPRGHEWFRLLFWVLPLRDPEFHSTGSGFVDILWYVRAYLWFVALSPALLMAFRKARTAALAAPLVLLPAAALMPHRLPGQGAVVDLLGYGTCWMLGFAEHDGFLAAIPLPLYGAVVAVLSAAGLVLELIFPFGASNNTAPNFIGYAFWSTAFVLILMRWRRDTSWLRRIRWLDRVVAVVNARAVTIYIWHDAAIVVTAMLVRISGWHIGHLGELPYVLLLTGLAVILFGWVEDLAARRRPMLVPGRRGAIPLE
jgi:peptidoglycan/LPS O-acetylase OafA/YrhL